MSESETAIQTAGAGVRQHHPYASPAVDEADGCPTCARDVGQAPLPASFVYAIGRIVPRFPQLSIEKEFAQAVGRVPTGGLTDREAYREVLARPENRYLARQLCWVMTIEGLDTYILAPRDPSDLAFLIDALRPRSRVEDIDVVIGIKYAIAPPTLCNGLTVPIVGFDQVYSFSMDDLMSSIPKPEDSDAERFRATTEEVFDRVTQITDNAGNTDEHRALNYLAMRYPTIYSLAFERHAAGSSLTGVDVKASRLSGARKIMDVIFTFESRTTGVADKSFIRVDVTEEFPFLVNRMSAFYDR
jgi:hypothetical protein